MAIAGHLTFPHEFHKELGFEAWIGDDLGPVNAIEADDGSAYWYLRVTDPDDADPVGVVIDYPNHIGDPPVIDRDVMLPDGSIVRLREDRARASRAAA